MPLKTEDFLPFSSICERFDFDQLLEELNYLLFKDARIQTAGFSGGFYLIEENIKSFDLQYQWNLEENFISQCYEFSTSAKEADLIATGRHNTRINQSTFSNMTQNLAQNSAYKSMRVWPLTSRGSIFGCLWIFAEEDNQIQGFIQEWISTLVQKVEDICY